MVTEAICKQAMRRHGQSVTSRIVDVGRGSRPIRSAIAERCAGAYGRRDRAPDRRVREADDAAAGGLADRAARAWAAP